MSISTSWRSLLACAPLAFLSATVWAVEPSASISSDAIAVIGGTFSHLGDTRLTLLSLQTAQLRGQPVRVENVRAALALPRFSLIGGEFRIVNGAVRRGLAKLLPDGRLDPDWHPEVDGSIAALAAVEDVLYVGGTFTAIGEEKRSNLACISLVDGKVLPWKADTDGPVQVLAATRSAVVAGGQFTTVAGESHFHLARLSADDGTPDPAFIGAVDSDVRALLIRGDQLYIGGQFSRINAEDRLGLGRVDLATGSVDPTWRADVAGAVFSFSALHDKLYVGGAFTAVAGLPRTNCARLSLADGKLEPWQPAPNEQVTGIAEGEAERIILSGRFTEIDGVAAPGLAVVSSVDGQLRVDWRPPAQSGNGATALAIFGENLLVGSSTIEGNSNQGIGWIGADGQIAGAQTTLDGSNPHVLCAVRDARYLYLGGDFSMVDGLARVGVARLDLANRHVDAAWRCDTDGAVRTLALADGQLFIGGDFTRLGGQACARVGRVSLKDGSIQAATGPIDGAVMGLLPAGDGVLITGNFTTIGGLVRHGLARLLFPAGTVDLNFISGLENEGTPGTGHAIATLDSTHFALGGRFTQAGGQPSVNLAILEIQTGHVIPWPGSADGPVFALLAAEGKLAVGGAFSLLSGAVRSHVGILDAQSGQVTPWRADTNAEVRALALIHEELWLGGDFTACGETPARYLARRTWTDAQPINIVSSSGRLEMIYGLSASPTP